jgi:hypothetical protein
VLVGKGKWVTVGLQTGIGPVENTTPDILRPMLDATSDTASLGAPPANSYPAPAKPAVPIFPPIRTPKFGVPDYSRTDDSGSSGNHSYHGDGGDTGGRGSSTN